MGRTTQRAADVADRGLRGDRDVEFDGPDTEPQRAWVDGVFEALGTEPHPHPGGIAGHFQVSADGTRVLNCAEWESAEVPGVTRWRP
ncbi:hypothetical protein ABT010_19370 [Streptomyces sp. NPDC002668]|uniref:hypothetical protein n=1 Tax=Streptomyces sp. NPDC002668 TaxID=3154422 RepID=UPI003329C3DD